MNQTADKGNKFFYGWIIVATATLALVVSNGLSIGGIPVFYKPVREDFVRAGAVAADQAESFIARGGTITFLVAGIFAPFVGWLIQKYGIRPLMIIGCFLLGGGLVFHSQTDSAAGVYFSRFLMGLSLCFVGVVPSTVLVSNWFSQKRGTAIGIILTGTSIGGVLIPQIATPLILNYGWRTAMLSLSLFVWLILLPAAILLVKNRPEEIGILPDGFVEDAEMVRRGDAGNLEGEKRRKREEEKSKFEIIEDRRPKTEDRNNEMGFTLGQALKTPIFWVLAACAALIFYPIFVTSQQFVLYLQTERIGLSAEKAAFALSALFFVSVGGKFFFGFLSDRFSPTRVMLFCCAVMFLASLVLLSLTANTAFLFLIPFGLGYGGTFVLLQRLTADYFGLREYGKILGAITLVETIGAAIGGIITGKLADAARGDYTQAFYGVILTTGLAFVCVVSLNFLRKDDQTAKKL